LFVKKEFHEEQMEVDEANENFIPEIKEVQYQWFYYDEEEEFKQLIDACNLKGIRERKLQENLRKISDRIKLKKSRAKKADNEEEKEEAHS
jgi:hypothetical protein